MFLQTEGRQILSVLQYRQAAFQARELKTPGFLQTQVRLFIIFLPPIVLTEVIPAILPPPN